MRLDLVVGPDGAGKHTFVELVLRRSRQGPVPWYDSVRWTRSVQAEMFATGQPATVSADFSESAELEFIDASRAAGHRVALHVLLVPEDLAMARVDTRAGFTSGLPVPVPEDVSRRRFGRMWPIVAEAVRRSDTAWVWDNSRYDGPREVARFTHGIPRAVSSWPTWTPPALLDRLGR